MKPICLRSFALLGALLVATGAAQEAKSDTFDRPSGPLGADWNMQTGNLSITGSGQMEGGVPFGLSWALHNTFNAPYSSQVLRADWDVSGQQLGRVILVAGAAANWSGVSVRIGDNNGNGMADRVWFEAAVNAGAWFTSSTPSTFNLSPQIPSGTATVWFTNGGDTVNLRVEGGGSTQVFSASGITTSPFQPASPLVGVGAQGMGRIDDFQAWVGSPDDPAFTATQGRVGSATTLLVTGAQPGASTVAVGVSFAPFNPIATPSGILGLALPIDIPVSLSPDANGRASLMLPPWDPSLSGFSVNVQALDLQTSRLSNYFEVDVL